MGSILTLNPLDSSPATAAALPRSPEVLAEARLRSMVEQYFDFIWRSVRRLGVGPADADDLTQRTFWLGAQRLDRIEPGSERAYLFAIAVRVTSNFRRARSRDQRRELPDDEAVQLAVDTAADIEALVDQKKARALLDRVLDELPLDLRTVLVLAEGEQMTMAEISQLLEVPPGTIASRLRRAREAFNARVAEIAEQATHREAP